MEKNLLLKTEDHKFYINTWGCQGRIQAVAHPPPPAERESSREYVHQEGTAVDLKVSIL